MAQVTNLNERYQFRYEKGRQVIRRKQKRDYSRLQNFLDKFVKENDIKIGKQAITLSKEEIHGLLGLSGSYDRYQANRQLAEQIEQHLHNYLVVFYQRDWKFYFDFIPLRENQKKAENK